MQQPVGDWRQTSLPFVYGYGTSPLNLPLTATIGDFASKLNYDSKTLASINQQHLEHCLESMKSVGDAAAAAVAHASSCQFFATTISRHNFVFRAKMTGSHRHCLLFLLEHNEELLINWGTKLFSGPDDLELLLSVLGVQNWHGEMRWMLEWYTQQPTCFLRAFGNAGNFFEAIRNAFMVVMRWAGRFAATEHLYDSALSVMRCIFHTPAPDELGIPIYCPPEVGHHRCARQQALGFDIPRMSKQEALEFARGFVACVRRSCPELLYGPWRTMFEYHFSVSEDVPLWDIFGHHCEMLLPAVLEYYRIGNIRCIFEQIWNGSGFSSRMATVRRLWSLPYWGEGNSSSVAEKLIEQDPPQTQEERKMLLADVQAIEADERLPTETQLRAQAISHKFGAAGAPLVTAITFA